ncbi:hypothetical protein TsFJ059_009862 [Trichoderma semiorbis]|uniref:Uncharacterized protein n=1 Tax=Trichoderma semiorbis TaxID=1491008 RepID=A0A9P8HJS9_9HYPO|nr:hypothetical protein TsFJ059_009862 [Trichoderma semiorbis]
MKASLALLVATCASGSLARSLGDINPEVDARSVVVGDSGHVEAYPVYAYPYDDETSITGGGPGDGKDDGKGKGKGKDDGKGKGKGKGKDDGKGKGKDDGKGKGKGKDDGKGKGKGKDDGKRERKGQR